MLNFKEKIATFAGECVWCTQAGFDKAEGVQAVISGYSGSEKKNPSYYEVSSGKTKHREAVQVHYNPEITSYEELLEIFWKIIDPTDSDGQFADRGHQYKTAIFYHDEKQKELAKKSKKQIAKKYDEPIATEILPFKNFYPAEDKHQKYYLKNPERYEAYYKGSGRKNTLS